MRVADAAELPARNVTNINQSTTKIPDAERL
jgi:hypothetical protein